jgi:protease YdgD
MFGARSCGLLLFAALSISMPSAANSDAIGSSTLHREAVDEQSYPWSSIGKLLNETGGSCSGVVIGRDKILTAAHCLFNSRTGRFIAAEALHFLVGYRTGHYSAHARIQSYEIGAGFDPWRYEQTSGDDWAVLTVAERLPADIEPLRLRRDLAPSGTKAVIAGYPQDRAHAMTADRNCELREKINAGRLFLHTCRGIKGYSGAPILVTAGDDEIQIAGIQIATMQSDGTTKMIAVPAQAIWQQDRDGTREFARLAKAPVGDTVCRAADGSGRYDAVQLSSIRARLDLDQFRLGQFETTALNPIQPNNSPAHAMAWLAFEPFAVGVP